MTSLPLAASIAAIVSAVIALVSLFISLHTRSRVKRFEIEIGQIKSSGIFISPNIGEVNIYPMVKGGTRNDEAEDEGKSEG